MPVLGLIIPFVFPIFFPGVLVVPFYIWMVRDSATRSTLRGGKKAFWLTVNIFVPLVGNFIYFVAERPRHLPPPESAQHATDEPPNETSGATNLKDPMA